MRNLLVTGGAGFIGSNFLRHVLSRTSDLQMINLDALTYAGSRENLRDLPDPERHHFIEGDICNGPLLDRLMAEFEIDAIVHFAAESHVDRSIADPAPFLRTNVRGTMTLLDAARKHWLESGEGAHPQNRFHHISTDEVYGSLAPEEPAWVEDASYAPNSPYAASKAAGDHLVRAYGHTYGLPYTITVSTNNYGPYQYPEKLIPLLIARARAGKPLPIYGDGQQIRDWLYVADNCRAIWKVVRGGKSGETYHVGGDVQVTNLAVAEQICNLLDRWLPDSPFRPHRELIKMVDDRPGHDRRYHLDTSKIQRELDWQPETAFAEGLERTVRWYLDHPRWVEKVRGGSK